MKSTPRTTVPFRRKRDGLTNYRKRLALIKSGKVRLVIRRSHKKVTVQFISFEPKGDNVMITVQSGALLSKGWKGSTGNIPASYTTGFLAGSKAKELGVKTAVVDLGLHKSTKGSRLYAAVKGAIDAGISIAVDEKMLPNQDTLNGKFTLSQQTQTILQSIGGK